MAERLEARRPKRLEAAPRLLAASDGLGLAAGAERREEEEVRRGRGATVISEDGGSMAPREQATSAENASVHRLARDIAARLSLSPPRHRRTHRGFGRMESRPFRGDAHELDLDRTMDVLIERRPLRSEEIHVTERTSLRRAVVLACDVSGSMRGERLQTLAAAVGAVTAELARDLLWVIAFASDAWVLSRAGEAVTLEKIIDSLLDLRPNGLTNLTFPLEYAMGELARIGRADRRVVLLSDCVHNAGPDPRAVAARIPRLDVLLDAKAECDVKLARDLGRIGRGRVFPVRTPDEVVRGLGEILG